MSETTAIELEIGASFQGWPVVVKFAGRLDQLGRVVEKLESAGLRPAGRDTPAPKARRERVEPAYRPDGVACCPKHQKPLREGAYGLHCTAKDAEGKNGYCDLKFAE